AFLMDEIIIHGLTQNVDPTGAKNSDLVIFAFAPQEPIAFGMVFTPLPPPGSWSIGQLGSVSMGTGDFNTGGFLVNVTPEPATLGLIALGGLAVIRRRRS
ncbi:MAG: PEP-CTERM sorting domain-containing protein, partial [Phycisphaerae bacterium]